MELKNNQISYVEFKTNDIQKIKDFYTKSFYWDFIDYGRTYTTFSKSGLRGGFEQTDAEIVSGALLVLYYKNLDEVQKRIVNYGGKISKDIFPFPGGRRFHFKDPTGNELAVWSDK